MRINSILFGMLFAMFSMQAFAQTASPVPAPVVASVVDVPAPAAPPQWASDLIMQAQAFPIVGPYISKALVYAGILSSILTALAGFLLSVLTALTSVLNISGASGIADKINAFKKGNIMYYLQYLSMFNAKKPDVVAVDVASAPVSVNKAA